MQRQENRPQHFLRHDAGRCQDRGAQADVDAEMLGPGPEAPDPVVVTDEWDLATLILDRLPGSLRALTRVGGVV